MRGAACPRPAVPLPAARAGRGRSRASSSGSAVRRRARGAPRSVGGGGDEALSAQLGDYGTHGPRQGLRREATATAAMRCSHRSCTAAMGPRVTVLRTEPMPAGEHHSAGQTASAGATM